MAEAKTKMNDKSVAGFITGITDQDRREDCRQLLGIMKRVTRTQPRMWGDSIVGFGSYHYVYASGREGDWPATAFSPRKQNLTIYIMSGFEVHAALMKRLGKFTTGKSCLYVKRLADIDVKVLETLIADSLKKLPICCATSHKTLNKK